MLLSSGTNPKGQCGISEYLIKFQQILPKTRTPCKSRHIFRSAQVPKFLPSFIPSLSFSPLPFPPPPLPVPATVMQLLLQISFPQPVIPLLLIMFPALISGMMLILVPLLCATIPFQEEKKEYT